MRSSSRSGRYYVLLQITIIIMLVFFIFRWIHPTIAVVSAIFGSLGTLIIPGYLSLRLLHYEKPSVCEQVLCSIPISVLLSSFVFLILFATKNLHLGVPSLFLLCETLAILLVIRDYVQGVHPTRKEELRRISGRWSITNGRDQTVLFVITLAIVLILILFVQNPMPPGKDIWGVTSLGSGNMLDSDWIDGFVTYSIDPLSSSELHSMKYRFVQFLYFYSLGNFFQAAWDPIFFAWFLIGMTYVVLSVAIYVLTYRLTGSNFVALLSSILSTISIGQLMLVTRINIGESTGLIFMLVSLISYHDLLGKKNIRNFILTLLFCITLIFTHEQPTILFFSIIVIYQLLSLFVTRPKRLWLKNASTTALLISVVGVIYVSYSAVVRSGESLGAFLRVSSNLGPIGLPEAEILKIFGYVAVILSIFGILGWRKISKDSYVLLISWSMVAVLYPHQSYLGINILDQGLLQTRSFQEFYVLINILSSLGLFCLIEGSYHLRVFKHEISLRSVVALLFVTLTLLTCTMGYVTDSSFTSIYSLERVYTTEQYEAVFWLKENVSPNNTIVLAEHNYAILFSNLAGFEVIRLSYSSLSSFEGPFDLIDAERLERILQRTEEYWLSMDYEIIFAMSADLPNIEVPAVFSELYKNSEVTLYKASPKFRSGTGPPVKVMFDSKVHAVSTRYEGLGPVNATFSLTLKGSNSYRIFDIPQFFTFGQIIPKPELCSFEDEELFMYGNESETYEILFKGHFSYPYTIWKEDFLSSNWIPSSGNGNYSIENGLLNISKDFKAGNHGEQFWIETEIDVDTSSYPYLIIRFKGDNQAKLQLTTVSQAGDSWNALPIYPASPDWAVYIVNAPPIKLRSIRIGINDLEWDIGEFHSILVDYVAFAQYKPLSPWIEYCSIGDDVVFDTAWCSSHGWLKPNVTQGPQLTEGKFGSALHFDGKDDYVEISSDESLTFDVDDEITIALWAKPSNVSLYKTLISKRTGAGNYAFRLNNGLIEFYYRNFENINWNVFSTIDKYAVIGDWTHFAVTYTFGQKSSIQIYINGKTVSGEWVRGEGSDAPLTAYMHNLPVRIGVVGGIEQLFEGDLDEVRIFQRSLTSTEIQDLMGGKAIRNGLVGEWLFEDLGLS